MTPKQINKLRTRLDKCANDVSKLRDQLREIAGEAEDLGECCDRAEQSLSDATDALSELV